MSIFKGRMKYYLYMKIDIFCKNIELDAPLKQFVEEKVGDLEKYIGHGPAEARVEAGHSFAPK